MYGEDTLVSEHLGTIGQNLDSITTSFQYSQSAIELLPEWMKAHLPKYEENRSHQHHRLLYEKGQLFIGSKRNPAHFCTASRLSRQLVAHGLVPINVKGYIRKLRHITGTPVYRINFTWAKRGTDDRPETDEAIVHNRALFDRMQEDTWDIRCKAFFNEGLKRILIDFRGRTTLPPSKQLITLGIKNNELRVLDL